MGMRLHLISLHMCGYIMTISFSMFIPVTPCARPCTSFHLFHTHTMIHTHTHTLTQHTHTHTHNTHTHTHSHTLTNQDTPLWELRDSNKPEGGEETKMVEHVYVAPEAAVRKPHATTAPAKLANPPTLQPTAKPR